MSNAQDTSTVQRGLYLMEKSSLVVAQEPRLSLLSQYLKNWLEKKEGTQLKSLSCLNENNVP